MATTEFIVHQEFIVHHKLLSQVW